MIDSEDDKRIEKMIFKVMTDVLDHMIIPKFDEIDNRFNKIEEKVDNLATAVEVIDSDMGGVKMRLKVIENKLDNIQDTSLVVQNHEKRIKTLESVQA